MKVAVLCVICKVGTMTDAGDCRNPECVCSARLLYADEVVRGTFEVDGAYTARFADGSMGGQFRAVKVDREWADAVLAYAKVGNG